MLLEKERGQRKTQDTSKDKEDEYIKLFVWKQRNHFSFSK